MLQPGTAAFNEAIANSTGQNLLTFSDAWERLGTH